VFPGLRLAERLGIEVLAISESVGYVNANVAAIKME
jgi:hypothetical protein